MEYLASLSLQQIIEEIIKKAGIIDYERLVRLLLSASKLAKHQLPSE
jgi:hypothetical protein